MSLDIERFPNEVLQNICNKLSLDDLKSARQACKILAGAGARYLLHTVYITNDRASIKRAYEIRQHPLIGPYVTTLDIDLAKLQDGPTRHSDSERLREPTRNDSDDLKMTDKGFDARVSDSSPYMTDNLPMVYRGHADIKRLVVSAQPCTSSNYVRREKDCKGNWRNLHRSYDKVLLSILRSEIRPYSLTVTCVHLEFFEDQVADTDMLGMLAGVENVSLELCGCRAFTQPANLPLPPGKATPWNGIERAKSLKSFKLDGRSLEFMQRPIANLLTTCCWAKLEQVTLEQLYVTEDELATFILKHKSSLKILQIQNLDMTHGNWHSFFPAIAGKLAKLETVRIRGVLGHHSRMPPIRCMDATDTASLEAHRRFTTDLEWFVKDGRDFPSLKDFLEPRDRPFVARPRVN